MPDESEPLKGKQGRRILDCGYMEVWDGEKFVKVSTNGEPVPENAPSILSPNLTELMAKSLREREWCPTCRRKRPVGHSHEGLDWCSTCQRLRPPEHNHDPQPRDDARVCDGCGRFNEECSC